MFIRLTQLPEKSVRHYNLLDVLWFAKCKEGTEVRFRDGERILVKESTTHIYKQLQDQRKR